MFKKYARIVYNNNRVFSIKWRNNRVEIERKFLVKMLPNNLEKYEKHEVTQAYICTDPVIRCRKSGEKYYLTIKSSGLLKREEHEFMITKDQFNNLLKKSEGNIICKTRYKIPEKDGLTIELDIFHGIFEGLIYAEVEFPTEDKAKKYNPPAFIGREVTGDGSYQNSSLSRMDKSLILDFISNIRTCTDTDKS